MSANDTNASGDIRVIKTLSDNISRLVMQEEKVRQDLYQARCEVQKLEAKEKYTKKDLAEAREVIASYAPDWEHQIKIEHWKDY